MKIIGTAPGKVILTGEHAVVYGKVALVTRISLGVEAELVEGNGTEKNPLITRAIELAGGDINTEIMINSNLPVGSGLGSSAATAAAIIKAVRERLGKPIEEDELFRLTLECEKLAHGNPSGIDPAAVVYGGLIAYVKGKPFERLKIGNPIRLLLVNSGKPKETTKEMVELVAESPDKEAIIDQIEKVVVKVRERLVGGDDIAELLNQNGLLLEELGVVGETAKNLTQELRNVGASVKITGAGGVVGGSGMMIVIKEDLTQIKKILDNKQIDYFETVIGDK